MQYPTISDLTKARAEFEDTAEEASKKVGCSRAYLYEVLKYPAKNRELHARITEYCKQARIEEAKRLAV